MTQQEFNNLSKRYLKGQATKDEEALLVEWFNAQPPQTDLSLSAAQKNKIEKRIWQSLHRQINPFSSRIIVKMAWFSGIAACLVAGFFWFSSSSASSIQQRQIGATQAIEETGIELKNTTQVEQEILLKDGTVVLLKKNSSLVYDKSFNKINRVVYLKGEAFFKVKRNVTKPFIVHSGTLITEVLGTSFRIKPTANSNLIEVAVSTGRVSVYVKKTNRSLEQNGVILTPNQRVMFDVSAQSIISSIVEVPVPLVVSEDIKAKLVFQTVPLQTVLNTLSAVYGIEFIVANPKVKDCRITADLSELSMFTQLELICKSIDATYEKRGTVIFIIGDGC